MNTGFIVGDAPKDTCSPGYVGWPSYRSRVRITCIAAAFTVAVTADAAATAPVPGRTEEVASGTERVRVEYDDRTLVVDGVRHDPEAHVEECGSEVYLCSVARIGLAWVKGIVLVRFQDAGLDAAVRVLSRYGLVAVPWDEPVDNLGLRVRVPVSFESQWAKALATHPRVLEARVARMLGPDPRWSPRERGRPAVPHVNYDGETLVVHGTRYSRITGMDYCRLESWMVCGPRGVGGWRLGAIVVYPLPGRKRELVARLRDYGLTAFERDVQLEGNLQVEVPGFYEDQWARALRGDPDVRHASVDSPLRPPQSFSTGAAAPLHRFGDSGLSPDQREMLLDKFEQMRREDACGRVFALVIGHADVSEVASIAAARADRVGALLARRGRGMLELHVENKGARQPVAPAGDPRNARTEVELLADPVRRDCGARRTR